MSAHSHLLVGTLNPVELAETEVFVSKPEDYGRPVVPTTEDLRAVVVDYQRHAGSVDSSVPAHFQQLSQVVYSHLGN